MVDVFQLAISKISGVGTRTAQAIVKNMGSAQALFEEKEHNLRLIFKNKEQTIQDILSRRMFDTCYKEIEFMQQYNIRSYFFTDDDYPYRLKQIPDKPVCLFIHGNGNINAERVAAVVGSRKCTDYGRMWTEKIIEELQKLNVTVISGLAYGIDSVAHTNCIDRNMSTFGVLGHGLDMIYPKEHFDLAKRMQINGGLITEYFTNTRPNGYNFPARNRIIAGLSDLVIVAEASIHGGALSTARLANDYDREVLALPGRISDKNSEGCNYLIENNRAAILSNVSSIANLMQWNQQVVTSKPVTVASGSINVQSKQPSVSVDKGNNLTGNDKKVYGIIKQNPNIDIDTLSVETNLNTGVLAAVILNLELSDYIITKPGKVFTVKE